MLTGKTQACQGSKPHTRALVTGWFPRHYLQLAQLEKPTLFQKPA
jgi:hypothetical protein